MKQQWEVILTSVNAVQPERLQLHKWIFRSCLGVCVPVLSPSACQMGRGARKKVGGFFRLRGRIFQNWVTNFGRMFLTNFFLGVSAVSCTFGQEKNQSTKLTTTSVLHAGGVCTGFFPVYHSRVRGWDTPALDQTGCAKSCQQWGGAKLGWVVSFVSTGRWQAFRRKRWQQPELQQHCFFLWISSVCWFESRACAGDSLWKVRGPQKYHRIRPPRNLATAQHQHLNTPVRMNFWPLALVLKGKV